MIDWWMATSDAAFPDQESSNSFSDRMKMFNVSLKQFRRGRISPYTVQVSHYGTFIDCTTLLTVIKYTVADSSGLFTGMSIDRCESPRTCNDVRACVEKERTRNDG